MGKPASWTAAREELHQCPMTSEVEKREEKVPGPHCIPVYVLCVKNRRTYMIGRSGEGKDAQKYGVRI